MLDVKRLALLRELELRGSIDATARVLGISPSAVSQQLTKLESEVGVVLLEQVGRNIRLTPAAEQLVLRVEEVVAVLERAETELESRRSRIQGVVRFAGFSTFARRYLPEVLRLMEQTHPDVVVEFMQLEPETALDMVASKRVDIAVIDEYSHSPRRADPGIVRTHLMRDQIDVYTPHPVPSLQALAGLHWAFEPAGSDSAQWATRICREFGFEPAVLFESPDPQVHQELVLAGVAAAFLPQMLLESPRVPSLPMSHWTSLPQGVEDEMYRDVYAVCRRGAQLRPEFAGFLKLLGEVTAKQPTHLSP
ncbi:LysR family transcriptional regulator [Paeniglutamicibacter antarcticus]|uniref:LysR family transcriptional regulator n=1 Tax=Paeniglutamicibacter antarcticus TaxID=494023 RepID=A0ABP9TG20_9MICC